MTALDQLFEFYGLTHEEWNKLVENRFEEIKKFLLTLPADTPQQRLVNLVALDNLGEQAEVLIRGTLGRFKMENDPEFIKDILENTNEETAH